MLFILTIDPSTVFSTFHMDQLRKIGRRHRKERLEIGKIAKLKVIRLKQAKISLLKVAKIYRRLYDGGKVCVPHHRQTSVKFRDFKEPYLCYF